ncbi:TPA: tail fiber domain-containing protein [Klebsiella pneumoniae]|uniref:tail fiber domain-containing protein n=1 Tax=Klebsiella pneumoniae TaxID=573 RepID=UPI001E2AFE13|nr:tail fiber domain-containing protein [Klebsiella pneumoniae]HDG7679683.1 tail fiber domain-containing protein [Klebsiella quasipneumoniae]MCD9355208.1 tail fiber domain-containing protein [Klebsiella pneumoniae]WEE66520.1 tail fiber domain-containing protein [Klebsiella pneumoniae]HBQ4928658.1 tail fiber domain-containing protein [Klebsiella pneumoniae]HBQ9266364.1 tail fiber domain-containing protein [Klebsiella pneumoniae]
MAMYEVGTVTGAANQAKVTGISTKWSEPALGIQEGSILVIYRNGSADLYAIKSVNNDTQLTLTRNITTAFSGAKYGIITSETASTSSFANQLASAFTLWRNVVQGWSTALTGSGDITMTDPITGTSVTVPAVSGMAKASDLAELRNSLKDSAKTSAANTFTQTQIFSKGVTFSATITAAGQILRKNSNTQFTAIDAGNLEISSDTTPYIDFHHKGSAADYTHRIITEDGALAIYPALRVRGGTGLYGATTLYGDIWWGYVATRLSDPVNPAIGTIINTPNSCWKFQSRGADSKGATAGMATAWFEEQVGTNHRLALSVQGFNANQQWWQFLSDGRIYSSQNGNVQFQGTSDARLKHDIKPTDGQLSFDRIRQLELVTFIYNDDEQERVRRGIIAQQAQEVDPQYVKQMRTSYISNGEQIDDDRLQLDNNVIMMDTLAAVKVLIQRVEALENKLNSTEEKEPPVNTNQNTLDAGLAMSDEYK